VVAGTGSDVIVTKISSAESEADARADAATRIVSEQAHARERRRLSSSPRSTDPEDLKLITSARRAGRTRPLRVRRPDTDGTRVRAASVQLDTCLSRGRSCRGNGGLSGEALKPLRVAGKASG
jgi:hypothetical protein